jgi:hypothetical protein
MGAYTCDECRPPKGDGWHYRENPHNPCELIAEPCPSKEAARADESAQELAKLAHENAWAAAQQIMRDVADTMPRFNANEVRERFEDARIPTSLIGSAFTWAAKRELIVKEAERVMSDQATTRHEIASWRSLSYGRQAS